jgi:NADPH:quinone reductase-like Zn-dependent oxidoreductase
VRDVHCRHGASVLKSRKKANAKEVSNMLALVRDQRHDPPVALREVSEPEPAADEALIEVRASSINRGELALLAARPDGWRPGQDIAGVVARPAASGAGPAAGARVVGLVEGAGWSQRAAVPVPRLAELDGAVSFEDAATLGLAGRTALRTVRLAGPLLGRDVLVLGAGGSVGQLVVQLAARAGGRVTAQLRDTAPAKQALQLGAERVIAAEEPERDAFDVVIDGVGGASLERAVHAIRPRGTIVLYGATDPEPAKLTLLDFIGHEGARILTYFSYASGDERTIGEDLAVLAEMVARGQVRPAIATVVDWHDAERALIALRSGGLAGKAVLVMTS